MTHHYDTHEQAIAAAKYRAGRGRCPGWTYQAERIVVGDDSHSVVRVRNDSGSHVGFLNERSITAHEIREENLYVTLDDGQQWVAIGFAGAVSAQDAWDDITDSCYSFEEACEEYDFERVDD